MIAHVILFQPRPDLTEADRLQIFEAFTAATVTLGQVDNSGGQYLNDLTVTLFDATEANANQVAGVLKLTGDISLDNNAADVGGFTVTGGLAGTTLLARRGQVRVVPDALDADQAITIDTEQGNNGSAGDVELGTTRVTANTARTSRRCTPPCSRRRPKPVARP